MQLSATAGYNGMKTLEEQTGKTKGQIEKLTPKEFKALAESIGITKEKMQQMLDQNTDLDNFGKIAGMTGAQFAKAFKKDAVSAIGAFVQGLGTASEKGTTAIEMLNDMGISEVRLRDSLLRAGNAQELFASAVEMSNRAWEENTALTEEAAKRNETLESQYAILKNTAKEFGISIYDNLQEPLKEITKLGQEYMKQLNTAFQEEGISGLVDEVGKVLSDILTKVIEYAPKIIESAVSMVSTLIEGIIDNLPQIMEAATKIILVLVEGLIKMLPLLIDGALKIISTLAKGIGEALPELIPAIVDVVIAIVYALIDNLPMILDAALQIILGLQRGILDALPKLVAELPAIITAIVDFIIEALPQIIDAGIQFFVALVTALPEIITTIVAVIPQIVAAISAALIQLIPIIIEAGIDLMVSMLDAWPTIIKELIKAIPIIVDGLVKAIVGNVDKIMIAGIDLFIAMAKALPTIIKEVVKVVPQIIKAIVSAFSESKEKMKEIGKSLLEGVWKGISDAGKWLKDKVNSLLKDVVGGIKDFLGIKSPSKVFAEIGGFMAEGLGEGFGGEMDGISDNMQDAMKDAGEDTAKMAITAIGEGLITEMVLLDKAVFAVIGRILQELEAQNDAVLEQGKTYGELLAVGIGAGFTSGMKQVAQTLQVATEPNARPYAGGSGYFDETSVPGSERGAWDGNVTVNVTNLLNGRQIASETTTEVIRGITREQNSRRRTRGE